MSKKTVGIVELLLCSALWSTAGILLKMIPWGAIQICGIRSAIAALVLYIYIRAKGRRLLINRRSLMGAAAAGSTFILFVFANKLTTAANAIVLQFTAPVFILILSAVFLRQKLNPRDVLAVAFTLGGIALLFVGGLASGGTLGNILAVCSGFTFGSMYLMLGTGGETERMSALFMGNMLAFLVSIPFLITDTPAFTGGSVFWVVILGIFQLGIPYVLYSEGAGVVTPLTCSLLGALEPMLNPLWVFIFDGETPGALALAGCAVVIVTVTLWCVTGHRKDSVPT